MPKGARKPVFCVGINDYPGTSSWMINGIRYRCPLYRKWVSMLNRCYKLAYSEQFPTYVGCYVSDEWKYFSNFRSWMQQQDWEGKELDKDLLVKGNKVYSADTCVFVSRQVNSFMNDHGRARGEYPIGVSWHKSTETFVAAISNPFAKGGGSEHIGLFDNPEDAHLAWKQKKHEFACILAGMQSDPRVAEALRTRYL